MVWFTAPEWRRRFAPNHPACCHGNRLSRVFTWRIKKWQPCLNTGVHPFEEKSCLSCWASLSVIGCRGERQAPPWKPNHSIACLRAGTPSLLAAMRKPADPARTWKSRARVLWTARPIRVIWTQTQHAYDVGVLSQATDGIHGQLQTRVGRDAVQNHGHRTASSPDVHFIHLDLTALCRNSKFGQFITKIVGIKSQVIY
ncbi:hypothetical protein N1851_021448 [Merluccius polli]|uniref:Uncharacterized protein n=1 Tax=Merluccius polli TaxID=89951 RepID=A0AA47NWM3_MERPO|nr:hypothetical protein N1851_021448 [Merluccius polli]